VGHTFRIQTHQFCGEFGPINFAVNNQAQSIPSASNHGIQCVARPLQPMQPHAPHIAAYDCFCKVSRFHTFTVHNFAFGFWVRYRNPNLIMLMFQTDTLFNSTANQPFSPQCISWSQKSRQSQCTSPISSAISMLHRELSPSQSNTCFFNALSFDVVLDSLDPFDSSFSPLLDADAKSHFSISLRSTPKLSHHAGLVDHLETDPMDSSTSFPIRNLVPDSDSSSLFPKPFEQSNHLSFCFPTGIDVLPNHNDTELEALVSSARDREADKLLHELQRIHEQQLSSKDTDENVENALYFSKLVLSKARKMSDVTESLFDAQQAKSGITLTADASTLLSDLDVNQILSLGLPDDLCAPSNSCGRSRITKLQHEVLNTWFYSHLQWP
jgi:hypothetical protein